METEDSFEKKLLQKLIESKIVKHINLSDVKSEIDSKELNDLISKPFRIRIDSSGLIFTDDSGDEVACPNFGESISNDGEWLSDIIPGVTFDVEQGGNLRKAEEAESAYCCCIVYLVLNDDDFKKELVDVIKNYDYNSMSGLSNCKNFKDLLTEWQDLQSTVINVAISAAKYKISDLKKRYRKILAKWHSSKFGRRIAKP